MKVRFEGEKMLSYQELVHSLQFSILIVIPLKRESWWCYILLSGTWLLTAILLKRESPPMLLRCLFPERELPMLHHMFLHCNSLLFISIGSKCNTEPDGDKQGRKQCKSECTSKCWFIGFDWSRSCHYEKYKSHFKIQCHIISDDLGRGHLLSILAIKGVKCDQNQLWHGNIMGKVRLEKNLRVCVTGGWDMTF